VISILTAFNQTRFSVFGFRPKVFDKGDEGFGTLPFSSDGISNRTCDGDGFERRELDASVEVKGESPEIQDDIADTSLESRLVPSGLVGLDALTSINPNKKIISKQNNVLAYLFFPNTSSFNAANDNDLRELIDTAIELPSTVPYSRGYKIEGILVDYAFQNDYEPIKHSDTGVHPGEPYRLELELFYLRLIRPRKELAGYNPLSEVYKVDETISFDFQEIRHLEFPDIKPFDYSLPKPVTIYSNIPTMEPRFFVPASEIKADYMQNPSIPISGFTQSDIRIDFIQRSLISRYTKSELEVYSPRPQTFAKYDPKIRPLDDVVETSFHDSPRISVPSFVAETFPLEESINLHVHPNKSRNRNPNPESDISDIVVRAFEPRNEEQEQRIVYQETEPEPANDNSPRWAADDNYRERTENNNFSDDKNPRRNRNDFQFNYRNIKTKYKSILRNLKKRLMEISQTNNIKNKPNSDSPSLDNNYEVPTPQKLPELEKNPFDRETIEALEYSSYEHKRTTGAKDLGLVVYDMETGRYFGHNGRMQLPTGSINKVGLAATVAYYVQHGKLDWEQEITIRNDLIIENDGTYDFKEGQKIKLGDAVDLMLKRSVDTYFNHILLALGNGDTDTGKERHDKFMRDLGLPSIKIGDIHTETSNYNSTVAYGEDLVGLMYHIKIGNILEQGNSNRIIGAMEKEEWSPFFKGPRKITSKIDGMGILGIIEDRYIIFSEVNDFYGKILAEHAYNKLGDRITNRATPHGKIVINSLDKTLKTLGIILGGDLNRVYPNRAA